MYRLLFVFLGTRYLVVFLENEMKEMAEEYKKTYLNRNLRKWFRRHREIQNGK